jgi:hypothetical protein
MGILWSTWYAMLCWKPHQIIFFSSWRYLRKNVCIYFYGGLYKSFEMTVELFYKHVTWAIVFFVTQCPYLRGWHVGTKECTLYARIHIVVHLHIYLHLHFIWCNFKVVFVVLALSFINVPANEIIFTFRVQNDINLMNNTLFVYQMKPDQMVSNWPREINDGVICTRHLLIATAISLTPTTDSVWFQIMSKWYQQSSIPSHFSHIKYHYL